MVGALKNEMIRLAGVKEYPSLFKKIYLLFATSYGWLNIRDSMFKKLSARTIDLQCVSLERRMESQGEKKEIFINLYEGGIVC